MNQLQKIITLSIFLIVSSVSINGSQLPLHAIILNSTYTTLEQIHKIESTLDNGNVDINAKDRDGRTPLNLAVFLKKDLTLIQFLLKNGADANIPDLFNVTPLLNAMKLYQIDIAKALIVHGANPSYKSDNGQTAFEFARSKQAKAILALKM